MKKQTLLIVVNVDWFFISHRLGIAEEALRNDWEVYVACQDTGRSNEITANGVKFINLPFSRSGTNLLAELKTLYLFYKLYKRVKPDVVHHVTLKPVIYGSVIARILRIKGVLNAISGLGYTFTEGRRGRVQSLMIRLMRYGFNRSNMAMLFQNKDDYEEVKSLEVIPSTAKIYFIKGSGVDLQKFHFDELKIGKKVKILFPTRMLWDKGVRELKEATDILQERYKDRVLFVLAGLADKENRAGVTEDYMLAWQQEGYVEWIGYQKDMVEVYKNSNIVVLPSYREGMPKSLIEACAIGRPIITTNAIGCRECVEDGKNGYKVDVKSVESLASAIEKLVLSPEDCVRMGKYSRLKAEKEFSLKMVISRHLEIYSELNA